MPERDVETMGSSRLEGGDAAAESWRLVGLRARERLAAAALSCVLAAVMSSISPDLIVNIGLGCSRGSLVVVVVVVVTVVAVVIVFVLFQQSLEERSFCSS